MKTFVCADIHGNYWGLKQILERSNFNYKEDELICLGDIVDGYPDSKQCIEELMKIKNFILIRGNHDRWFLDWAEEDDRDMLWISQGGWNTVRSYDYKKPPQEHIDFMNKANYWVEDEERGMLFVHGGLDPRTKIDNQPIDMMLWDRALLQTAWDNRKKEGFTLTPYKEVFVGHTSSTYFGTREPLHACNVWCLDTGGGWHGKLTIMDIDTKEYWQSDLAEELYPVSKGRGDYHPHDQKVLEWLHGIKG